MKKHFSGAPAGLALIVLFVGGLFMFGQRSPAAEQPETQPVGPTSVPTLTVRMSPTRPQAGPAATAAPAKVGAGERKRSPATSTPAASEFDFPGVSHVIVEGETLTEIAAQYQTTVDLLLEANGLIDPHTLLVGQELVITAGLSAHDEPLVRGPFERRVIGLSTEGHALESFQLGDGRYQVIVIGAIHGGYEWNTALLAYRLLTYYSVYPERAPADVTLHIIPVANPDGLVAVTGKVGPFMAANISGDTTVGRLNGNGIDLNRNWGCEWSAVGQWREAAVSGGARPFSEVETRALRDYLLEVEPEVVIWLHSAAGLVIPGNCEDVYHEPSERAAALYGQRAGYPAGEFGAYQVTGDAADWLAQHRIASFSVELTGHQGMEFAQNLAGLTSLLESIETINEN